MIDLYYWTTPNGHKITIFLEEAQLDYNIIPVNISQGEQFDPAFLRIAPNNRIPAIVDHAPLHDKKPIAIFESGAILLYLAEKTKQFLAHDLHLRYETIQWLFWQMAGLGPMAGQNHHFAHYASEKIPYAIDRYRKETARLYAVLNTRLSRHTYIADDYSIADMACYPWIQKYEAQGQDLNHFPHLQRWFLAISEREAIERAYKIADRINTKATVNEESKKILFGQDDHTIADKI